MDFSFLNYGKFHINLILLVLTRLVKILIMIKGSFVENKVLPVHILKSLNLIQDTKANHFSNTCPLKDSWSLKVFVLKEFKVEK